MAKSPAKPTQQLPVLETSVNYAYDVVNGVIVAGKLLVKACERFLRDLEFGGTRGLRFDIQAAQRAVNFFGLLLHSQGEWGNTPFRLEPWQIFILANIFGFYKADGTRRFREAHIELARKNGKSTFIAGIGLYMLIADREPGAQVYSAATTKDQAKIVFDEADRMVSKSAFLSGKITRWRNNLNDPASASKFMPLSADDDTLDGLNIHCALVDELHAHPTRKLYDVLNTATGSRRQSLVFAITTAGFDRNSICWKQRTHGEKILSEIIEDDSFFAFICCMDEGDDWADEKNWPKANPNLGVSVKLEDLRRKAVKAKEDPSALNSFLRLHLNVWTSQDVRWMPEEKWDACCKAGRHIDPKKIRELALEDLKGRTCYGGLDLSSKIDITAFVLVFLPVPERKVPRVVDGKPVMQFGQAVMDVLPADPYYSIIPWFWVPKENVQDRVSKDRVEYDVWIRQQLLETTPGNVVDQEFVKEQIVTLRGQYDIREIGFDSWNNTWLAGSLAEAGLTMIDVRQGFKSLSEPMKEVMALTLQKRLEHYGNPILRWMIHNTSATMDPTGSIKPDKEASKEKIDGVAALVTAVSRIVANPNTGANPYETRGIVFI